MLFALTLATVCHAQPQAGAQTKPNILVIFGVDGKTEDTGALNTKRMETIDGHERP